MRKTAYFLAFTLVFWLSPFIAELKFRATPSFRGDKPSGLSALHAQAPTPTVVDSLAVKVLTGLLAPDFQEEMNHMVQAVGGSCNTCHVRGNFASEENPKKVTARRMLEMTKAINKQFFPDHKPKPGESVLGRVTCYTCHQGEATPKAPPGQ
ncbi:MAG: c-type cytochrome [Acidobacteriota bacterium]|nr:c-type cytochrome [Acidobacteriota bacterium]